MDRAPHRWWHESSDNALKLACDNPIVAEWVRDHHPAGTSKPSPEADYGPTFSGRAGAPGTPPAIHEEEEEEGLERVSEPFAAVRINPGIHLRAVRGQGTSNQFAAAAAEAVADRPGSPPTTRCTSTAGQDSARPTSCTPSVTASPPARPARLQKLEIVYHDHRAVRQRAHQLHPTSSRWRLFRQTFRGVDVLLLDDIQFIAGKERTQEEFFHTFNTLQSTGRQVVFTSDARPAGHPRSSRSGSVHDFLQGLIADIQPPDLETRCAILREKARAIGWELPEDVVLFIARRVQKNVRELEGSLNRTIAYAQLKNTRITVDVVRSALFELLPEERETTPADIIRFVAQHYGVRVADLKGRSNRRSIALPRQVAIYLIREILDLSFPEIGKIFSKHHSTAMYAVDNITKLRQSNPDFDATLTAFREHFG